MVFRILMTDFTDAIIGFLACDIGPKGRVSGVTAGRDIHHALDHGIVGTSGA
jgi:hypothetical protein